MIFSIRDGFILNQGASVLVSSSESEAYTVSFTWTVLTRQNLPASYVSDSYLHGKRDKSLMS